MAEEEGTSDDNVVDDKVVDDSQTGAVDDDKWDEAAAKKKFARMSADLKAQKAKVAELSPVAAAAEKKRQDDLSEVEKLKEANAALAKQLEGHSVKEMRVEAAEAAGLPAKFAKFITATDPAEALEQAKELAGEVGDKPNGGQNNSQQQVRQPDFRQGQRGTPPGGGAKPDMNEVLRQMARGR